MSHLFVLIQYLIPHHLFSRVVAWLMARKLWKNLLIRLFVKRYGVNLSEAEREQAEQYSSFNDFFTRRLKAGARPLPLSEEVIINPADGVISQLGAITAGSAGEGQQIFQAKGHYYSCQALLAGSPEEAKVFDNGYFATIYLSPKDYHRVHMPYTGTLRSMTYVPGSLFSVNPTTAAAIPGLFARNERVVCLFDTDLGPMAVILVGAMIVASIETRWAGQICPSRRAPGIERIDYRSQEQNIRLQTGDELGLFKSGSTVIVLFTDEALQPEPQLVAGSAVKMGMPLATARNAKRPSPSQP